jgi:hypothetical protein
VIIPAIVLIVILIEEIVIAQVAVRLDVIIAG